MSLNKFIIRYKIIYIRLTTAKKNEKDNDLFLIILRNTVADFTKAIIHFEAFLQLKCQLNNLKRASYTVLPPQYQNIMATSA
jgi:hypothetical protein